MSRTPGLPATVVGASVVTRVYTDAADDVWVKPARLVCIYANAVPDDPETEETPPLTTGFHLAADLSATEALTFGDWEGTLTIIEFY